ncbi:response regulator transcription factor [Plantibacter sp. H53]|uniref:response regulator transcription factor n=1 Tax=Plantibacter sp. H53 TaxID=1827323 RepID=UPI0009ED0EFD|nr:response regulator transcription factor [Plantibacter sp. H53]
MSLTPYSPDSARIRVLVVDDEANLRHLLSAVLRQQGWKVLVAADGASAVAQARDHRPHLVVLDVVLPDMDGLEVLERIREDLPDTLVLFLTANSSVSDRISGITAGGDDYVTKPFSIDEVVARLRGLARRSPMLGQAVSPLMTVGDLILNEDSHAVSRGGEDITLTATEFALLRYLVENADRVLSKHQILDRVWEYDFGRESNIVELYISYLRKKIDAGRAPMIHTLRRVGYMLQAAPEETRPPDASASGGAPTVRERTA